MADVERTLVIVKPDAVALNCVGTIVGALETRGLQLAAARFRDLTKAEAKQFYDTHRGQPFFGLLTDFMSEGPILVAVFEGPRAIARAREIMGHTDPAKAAAGTIRRRFGTDVQRNAVHGSDSPETAEREIAFFFSSREIYARPPEPESPRPPHDSYVSIGTEQSD